MSHPPLLEIVGQITDGGQLTVTLPDGMPAGKVIIRIEYVDAPEDINAKDAAIEAEMPVAAAKPAKASGDPSAEWIKAQQRRALRHEQANRDYRLKWNRSRTQQRKKTLRRSLNREKS